MAYRRNKDNLLDISDANRRGMRFSGGVAKPRRTARKTLALIVVLIVASLLLAVAVGYFVYNMTVRNAVRISLDPSLSDELSEVESDANGWWGVIAATDASSAEAGHGSLSDVALFYADTKDKGISFLWVPTDTRVYVDGYGHRTLREAFELQGEVGLAAVMKKLSAENITHYAELNRMGVSRMIESLSLSGISAGNADAEDMTDAVCRKVFGSSGDQVEETSDVLELCISTDMDGDELEALVSSLQGMDFERICQAYAPTTSGEDGGEAYSAVDEEAWKTMVVRTGNGLAPVASEEETAANAQMREQATVVIRNGVGVSGIAGDCSDELGSMGWHITDTDNASQFVYEETLVVYKDSDDEGLAELLVSDLRQGRVVKNGARYSFDADLLVVIGQDYQP